MFIDRKIKVSLTSHTAKLFYRDILIKGSINKNVTNTSKKGSLDIKYPFSISYDQREEGLKLYYKGLDTISDMAEKKIEKKLTNYDLNNIDNLPETPKDHLIEKEVRKLS
ncbi:4108_t:CDS:1 [Funneliformis caledonium]|uniref:4108_t:CDS:1 n=1 Tax=Funneliformis caledonium TaxID=1117310 RepID=A0A9N8W7I6_9GLOM|nr:4108_t:CDS:1 [Funneliformis caledonium]